MGDGVPQGNLGSDADQLAKKNERDCCLPAPLLRNSAAYVAPCDGVDAIGHQADNEVVGGRHCHQLEAGDCNREDCVRADNKQADQNVASQGGSDDSSHTRVVAWQYIG